MAELDVRIVELPALKVASTLGFGSGPELEAWQKMDDFLKQRGLFDRKDTLEFYGFNNPDPSPGSPNYGYEEWVVVPEDLESVEGIEFKTFPGGLYAVTRCTGIMNIHATWKKLVAWREDSPYQHACHQWLEKWVNPTKEPISEDQAIMDLYLPIMA